MQLEELHFQMHFKSICIPIKMKNIQEIKWLMLYAIYVHADLPVPPWGLAEGPD
jgi:hypothetical protein